MKSIDFCQWLLGSLKLTDNAAMTPAQVEIIQKHLAMVFVYEIDPSYGSKQTELNKIHQSKRIDKWLKEEEIQHGPLNYESIEFSEKAWNNRKYNLGEPNPATNPLTDVPMERQGYTWIQNGVSHHWDHQMMEFVPDEKSLQQKIDDGEIEIMC